MKKYIFLIVCVFLGACAFKNSPKYISEDYFKAVQEDDFRRIKSYVYVPASVQSELSTKEIDEKLNERLSKLKEKLAQHGGVKEVKIIDKKELNSELTELQIELIYNDKSIDDERLNAVKIDGVWKIIFTL
ncbi:hypothetical protein DMB95_01900 [Campylobacter sp. MIT 12-8780]|uniref:DUF4878 domain-containing protein n=1 Tax=unclassified Campylobacter TaxID=2593542 RepID=UPI00115DB730|nr:MULTISPECIES: DUF4878 domain-containing protein [unclassified Campylobacter]NDJ26787.1 DUF4878 domain-containing protein [Campylobacter sp. MIT 19-121]TQR42392.1 hypothetical protein DMB95_01900 [Campylobacter sp. MIT 12-8780]